MFGKVQEDSFQNIFDFSLDDYGYDSKSFGLGLGLGTPSTSGSSPAGDSRVTSLLSSALQDHQTTGFLNSSGIWSNSLPHLQDEEENLSYKMKSSADSLQLPTPSGLEFPHAQLEQLQKLKQLTFGESAFVSSGVSSPTSSTDSSSSSTSGFDIPTTKSDKEQRQNNLIRRSRFLPSGNSEDRSQLSLDSHSDSSSLSSSCSSGSSKTSPSTCGQATAANRYKTELCRPFQESGICKYGDKCQFAHGAKELRTVTRHPKYKTDFCRTYHSSGFCPYGPRCHFIHNIEESQNNNSSGSKGTAAGKKMANNKEKDPGQVLQLPMFSSIQRNSPINESSQLQQLNLNNGKSPFQQQQHSPKATTISSHPTPFSDATGELPDTSNRSDASVDGGDAADSQAYAARLPVFSTMFN